MVNKGEETKDSVGEETKDTVNESESGTDRNKKYSIDWDKMFNPENMSPEELLRWIPFMLGRHAAHPTEDVVSDMSDKVDDFNHYITSSARLFKIETMVYLQVGFNIFMNGIESLMATKMPSESRDMLVLGILETSLGNIQNKIDEVKMKREQRIKEESSSGFN